MNEEIWKDVVGYEGQYMVSDRGRVKSLERICAAPRGQQRLVRERVKNAFVERSGHLIVGLCGGNMIKTFRVHRLVLEAFVGPCPAGMQCCHNDGKPANNRVGNLRWDSHQANMDDKVRHGTTQQGKQNGFAKLSDDAVREIRARLANGEKQFQIASAFGVCKSAVSRIGSRKAWKHI